MSAIGDYVHLNAANYLQYGIKRKKQSSPLAEIIAIKEKARIQATTVKVNREALYKLQNEYNAIKCVEVNIYMR